MPTGYTNDIYDGEELSGKEFIMKCARAFGACVEMRDDPMNKEIPEFKPSTYHQENIEKRKSELNKYQGMTIDEAKSLVEESYKNRTIENEKYIKNNIDLKNRYLKTLTEVLAWNVPTNEHEELKNYAIDQLRKSIEYDCGNMDYSKEINKDTPQEYINKNIERCLEDINYHTKKWEEEVKRIDSRNKWIKELRDSF